MGRYTNIVAEIKAGPRGPNVAAIFDFDGTIIHGFSAFIHVREQLKAGHLTPEQFFDLSRGMIAFGFGQTDFSSMMTLSAQFLAGMSRTELDEFAENVYEKYIAKRIYPESRALIEAHLEMGHTVAMISSATQFQVQPAAKDLGIEHCFFSELEFVGDKLSGKLEQTCFGQGKVRAAKELFAAKHVDTAESYFYSDGEEDIPLLELVGKPRPLNPTTKLEEYSKKKGWPIRHFNSRGFPSIARIGRSLGAYGAVVSSVAAGLPIFALTGSKRRARNFSLSLFADTAGALIGLDLRVRNEHHMWSHRPAVFIFNHQSKSDVTIMASLIRRDAVSVGKQEIKNIPVIGRVMEFTGMVMIDRKNSGSAIDAMKPLVDLIQNEGMSVCISPEGTRTISKKMAPFKKGAFHIAMQAGVPIVPVVIHNALDSAPKGQFVFNPCTVDVDILEPISTDDWRAEDLDDHIAAVRGKYEEVLALGAGTTANEGSPKPKKTARRSKPKSKPLDKSKAAKKQEKSPASKNNTNEGQAKIAKPKKAAKKSSRRVKLKAPDLTKLHSE